MNVVCRLPRRPLALGITLALSPLVHAADGVTIVPVSAEAANAVFVDQRPTGVSDDGSVLVGTLFADMNNGNPPLFHGFRFTQAGGFVDPTTVLPAHTTSSVGGVSSNGQVLAGDFGLPGVNFETRGYRLENGALQIIDPAPGDTFVRVTSLSADGKVVAGYTGRFGSQAYIFANGTLTNIDNLGGQSEAHALSADGSVVVGTSNFQAFRWTRASGMVRLGNLAPNNGFSSGDGVSADGSVVVGSTSPATGTDVHHAYRWTQSTGMVDLHTVAGNRSAATAVSGDGLVVVGSANFTTDTLSGHAFRWTQASGMQTVEQWLTANGVNVGTLRTREATATNSNGSVVVGVLDKGEAFIARVTPGAAGATGTAATGGVGGAGLISLNQFTSTLAQTQQATASTARASTTALQGAHSRPLSRRTGSAKSTFWVAGDWGDDSQGTRNGDLSLQEIGGGHNFGIFQFNLSAGHTSAYQRQALNGKSSQDGYYVHAEWMTEVWKREHDSLWAVATVYHHWGEGDIRRGYLNAGLPDSSMGSPTSRTWGMGTRAEWDRLIAFAGITANPYLDYVHIDSTQDGYTELGGGFPARYAKGRQTLDELRYGFDAERPLLETARLVAVVEGVHRFNSRAVNTTATLLGAGGFTVTTPGQRFEQDWLRGGAGVEADVLHGTASLMLNATTESEMPSYWVAASWRYRF